MSMGDLNVCRPSCVRAHEGMSRRRTYALRGDIEVFEVLEVFAKPKVENRSDPWPTRCLCVVPVRTPIHAMRAKSTTTRVVNAHS